MKVENYNLISDKDKQCLTDIVFNLAFWSEVEIKLSAKENGQFIISYKDKDNKVLELFKRNFSKIAVIDATATIYDTNYIYFSLIKN